jgi:3-hydroxymyristoyl/3-hydroxydecanoyl-(acyl carrier protein) dehydratase
LLDLKLPVPAIDLVPHRNRMLLIDSLDEFSKDTGRAHLKMSDENLFIMKDSRLDSIVYVELLAQLIAAHSGYKSKLDKSDPKVGFLVGLKDLKINQSVSAGDIIDIQIKKDYEFDQITFVTGKIFHKDQVISEGTLKLWEQAGGEVQLENPQEDNQPNMQFHITNQATRVIVERMNLNEAIVENIYDLKIQPDQTTAEAQLYFSNSFVGFDGHFPGSPLLPGILMMKTGLLISEISVGKHLCVKKVKHAKFAKSIFPGQKVNLNINLKVQKDSIQINAALTHNKETCAKYSILAKDEE